MAKSKTRLVADFMSKVKADPTTGEAIQEDVVAAAETGASTDIIYTKEEIDSMFDDVITEIENLTVV